MIASIAVVPARSDDVGVAADEHCRESATTIAATGMSRVIANALPTDADSVVTVTNVYSDRHVKGAQLYTFGSGSRGYGLDVRSSDYGVDAGH